MPLIYRKDKGVPLTIEELDGNFQFLHERMSVIERLQGATEQPFQFQVEQKGDVIVFKDASGKSAGQFRIPIPHLQPRGAWIPQVSYQVMDLVSYQDSTYICAQSHESSTFEAEQSCWQRLVTSFPTEARENLVGEEGNAPLSSQSMVPIYTRATLPKAASGTMAILFEDNSPKLVMAFGEKWWVLAGCQELN